MIIDRGYLYEGLVYYGGRPTILGPGNIWPRPLSRRTEPKDLKGEGPVKFKLEQGVVEIIFDFFPIR